MRSLDVRSTDGTFVQDLVGLYLAVAEIKLIQISLFYRYDVKLEDGGFYTPDLMNTTRVSPEAIVLVSRRAD